MRPTFLAATGLSLVLLAASQAGAIAPAHPRHSHRAASTASVTPNGTSCPNQNTRALVPPAGPGISAPDAIHGSAPLTNSVIAGNTTCPATGSDAQTNIARGPALAKPEPLNSPALIAPAPRR